MGTLQEAFLRDHRVLTRALTELVEPAGLAPELERRRILTAMDGVQKYSEERTSVWSASGVTAFVRARQTP